jgi:hypothetical protein
VSVGLRLLAGQLGAADWWISVAAQLACAAATYLALSAAGQDSPLVKPCWCRRGSLSTDKRQPTRLLTCFVPGRRCSRKVRPVGCDCYVAEIVGVVLMAMQVLAPVSALRQALWQPLTTCPNRMPYACWRWSVEGGECGSLNSSWPCFLVAAAAS